MVPLTTASAWSSPAGRRPSRSSTASRTARVTSWVRIGSAVRFSKGSTATVFTLEGKPPPVNPYFQRHPPEAALAISRSGTSPGVRRKGSGFHILIKGQVEPGCGMRHDQPGAHRETIGTEFRLDPAQPLSALAKIRDEPGYRPVFTDVLHSILAPRELPGSERAIGEMAHALGASGQQIGR